ncbi:hypothetical protein LY76DRAFT_179403 [Colletotrichum caudatum]|nr:hypothetical protein LY76DRAFT_179403 [Colletotrichum caudatum]
MCDHTRRRSQGVCVCVSERVCGKRRRQSAQRNVSGQPSFGNVCSERRPALPLFWKTRKPSSVPWGGRRLGTLHGTLSVAPSSDIIPSPGTSSPPLNLRGLATGLGANARRRVCVFADSTLPRRRICTMGGQEQGTGLQDLVLIRLGPWRGNQM